MALRWLLGDAVVDGGTFLPGKLIALEAVSPNPIPETLQVFQVYSSALRQILKHIGVPARSPGAYFVAQPSGSDRYRSDRPWKLPDPRGWRKSAAFVFAPNNSEQTSGQIYSSRVGKAGFRTKVGANLGDPTGTIPIGVEGSGKIAVDIHFARDPQLSIEVITGEDLATHMLRNLVEDYASDDDPDRADVAARVAIQVPELRDTLPPAYEPPRNWSIVPEESAITGEQDDDVSFTVELETRSQGTAYFALTFVDPISGEGETTDAWGVSVDANLNVSVITNPSEATLQIPATAHA